MAEETPKIKPTKKQIVANILVLGSYAVIMVSEHLLPNLGIVDEAQVKGLHDVFDGVKELLIAVAIFLNPEVAKNVAKSPFALIGKIFKR